MKIQKPGRAVGVARTLERASVFGFRYRKPHGVDLPAEDQCQREQKLGNVTRCFSCLNAGNDHVGERRGKQQEGPDEQEHERSTLGRLVGSNGITVHANGVIPADIDQTRHECIPWDLHYNVGNYEDLPGVSLRGTLANLVEGTLGDKMRHNLLDQVIEDGD